MTMMPLIRPDITFEEVSTDLAEVFASGRLTSGPFVANLEELIAEATECKHVVTTTSATTALHLALIALGVVPGDEVLVSDFTFPASGNVIVQAGAIPVLVDCLADSFLLDPADLANRVTDRTRAAIVVDPFGLPAPATAVRAVTDPLGIVVIEDAACAIGSKVNGDPCGSWSAAGCFSFHPRKVITTGEGGAITTNNDQLAERLRVLRNHGGQATNVGMTFTDFGFNYRLSEIAAVLGVAQLHRLEEITSDRRRTAMRYTQALLSVDGVLPPAVASDDKWNAQSYVVALDESIDRDSVIASMRSRGIETTLGTYAMHAQPSFARFGYRPGDLPHSWRAQQTSLTIPVLPRMSDSDIDRVVECLEESVLENRR